MRKAHNETFEMNEAESYIIQLLRGVIILLCPCLIILIDLSTINYMGLKLSLIGLIILIMLVTLLAYINAMFGNNIAKELQKRF